MNSEENLVIHTFNSDIQEELNRKDASLLNVATANVNHIEPTDPPNYKALFIVLFSFACLGAIAYAANLYIEYIYRAPVTVSTIQKNTNALASSTQIINTETFQTLMPNSYIGLNPYINLYVHNNKYLAYKISNYEGLINVMIANEPSIESDMRNYFGKNENFESFRDLAYNNWDMRIASSTATSSYIISSTSTIIKTSTSTLVYAIANKEYVIFATSIQDWESAYSTIIK